MFKPVESQVGMEMSVKKLSFPFAKIVEILGPPHKINEGDMIAKNLGYPTKAEWLFKFFGIIFKIKYDSSDWLLRNMEKQWEKGTNVGSQKIPPLEKITFGEIIGNVEFVQDIVSKILIILTGKSIPDFHKKQLVIDLFNSSKYKR